VVKVLHSVTKTLTERDFDELTRKLSSAIYDLDPNIEDIYKVHIDMINDDWHIEFVPKSSKTPIIKVDTYTTYNDNNHEILRINPVDIIKFPETVKLNSYEDALNSSSKLNAILDFLVELYDFEFHL
jgi:hypothetical protein